MAIKKIDSFNKHQNPSTNQNPFDVENYLNVNWDKAQETINNNADELKTAQDNISEIKQEQITQNTDIENIKKSNEEKAKEIASLKTELENEKSKFENYAIHGKATGEEIHLTDSSETDCRVDVRGNVKQETREGYNQLPSSEWVGRTFTHNGVTFTALKDGSVLIQGTLEATRADGLIKGSWENTTEIFTFEKGETYTLQLVGNNNSKITAFLINGKAQIINTKTAVTFSPTLNPTLFFIRFDGTVGETINTVVYPQLVKGSTKEKYEQYGAMPSLGYPSKIETVGSNKNIFNILKYDYRFYSCGSAEVRDNSNFRIIATRSTDQNCSVMFKILDLTKYAGKTLTIQAFAKSSTNTNKAFIVLRQNNFDYTGTKTNELYDETQNTTNGVIKLKYKVTDTINDNNKYLFIGFYATRGNVCAVGDYVDYEVKIEEGSVATSYSKFGQGSIKVTSYNKNLFSEIVNIKEEVTAYSHFVTGKFNLTKGKEYKLICNTNNNQLNCYINESIATNWTEFKCDGTKKNINFIAKNDVYNSVETVLIKSKSAGKYNISEVMIVEKNVTDYSYVQHKEDSVVLPIQEEMCALKVHENNQNYNYIAKDGTKYICDEIIKKDNKYYCRKWTDSLDVTSAKGAIVRTATNNVSINYFVEDLLHSVWNVITSFAMCNKFKQCTPNLVDKENSFAIWNGNKNIAITIDNSYLEDVSTSAKALESWNKLIKKWEAEGKPLKLIYCRENPKDIEITSQDTIQALEKLDKLKTYKNITNITTDSIAILDVDYKKDLETLINQVNQALVEGS